MAYEPPKPCTAFYRRGAQPQQQHRPGGGHADFPPPLLMTPVATIDDQRARHARVAHENGLDFEQLDKAWEGRTPDVKRHLFHPDGSPRYVIDVEIWRPLVRAYFVWFDIPRENCTRVWEEIVDCLLRLNTVAPLPEGFQAWAYGCFIKFYLGDRQRQRVSKTEAYDPMAPHL